MRGLTRYPCYLHYTHYVLGSREGKGNKECGVVTYNFDFDRDFAKGDPWDEDAGEVSDDDSGVTDDR